MNAARLDRSARLQRVLRYIRDRKRHSTRDIARGADVCAVNSCIAELRTHGHRIDCTRVGDVWWYQYRGKIKD